MKGHIRERSPGCWAIVLDHLDPITGRRKRRWHSFKGTKRQAQVRCAELVAELQSGAAIDPNWVAKGAGSRNPDAPAGPGGRFARAPSWQAAIPARKPRPR